MDRLTGAFIMTISTAFYALLYPLLKKANQQVPPFTVMAISMFVLFMLSLLASILFEGSLHMKSSIFKTNISFLVIAAVVNFIAFWLYILGYKYFPVWQQSMFTLLTPIFAGIFAYLILGEKITFNLFVGLLIMGVGLFIAVK